MGTEIERKYLVISDNWRSSGEKKIYHQGYLMIDKNITIRIRTIENQGYITIKGPTHGLTRIEFEYSIPFNDANDLIEHFCIKPVIIKYRTSIETEGLTWEVDEFLGENAGLVIAEVELRNEMQRINLPDWIGEEVTHDFRYTNSSLVKNPYKNWRQDNF